ncbi:MAG: hypothetical protein Q8O93_04825 [bacterium]|nr:hypothetical protein [bacterium]
MNKQNLDRLERELERRQELKKKRKKKRMKVSGSSVKNLAKIIVAKKC